MMRYQRNKDTRNQPEVFSSIYEINVVGARSMGIIPNETVLEDSFYPKHLSLEEGINEENRVHPPTVASPSIAPAPSDTMATLSSPPKQSTWDPFGDDSFSKLTAEDLLSNDLVKLEDGPADDVNTDSKRTLLSVPGTFEPLALSDTPEKLIEGLKSPETSLLLPDLLSLADPFGGAPAGPSNDALTAVDSLLGCSLLSNPPTPAVSSVSSPPSSASAATASILDEFAPALPLTDSSVLISELGQSDGTGTGAEDEFDPIPVLGSKTPAQGDHVSSNGGDSDSSLPNLARSLIMVDQLIDL